MTEALTIVAVLGIAFYAWAGIWVLSRLIEDIREHGW